MVGLSSAHLKLAILYQSVIVTVQAGGTDSRLTPCRAWRFSSGSYELEAYSSRVIARNYFSLGGGGGGGGGGEGGCQQMDND